MKAFQISRSRVFLFATAVLCLWGFNGADDRIEVKWDEIGRRVQISGSLGKTLGTYMTIEGKKATGPHMMNTPFEVDTVDGKKLTKPLVLDLQGLRDIKNEVRYKLRGYENGGIVGIGGDPEDPKHQEAQAIYGFSVYFEVTKVIEPAAVVEKN